MRYGFIALIRRMDQHNRTISIKTVKIPMKSGMEFHQSINLSKTSEMLIIVSLISGIQDTVRASTSKNLIRLRIGSLSDVLKLPYQQYIFIQRF